MDAAELLAEQGVNASVVKAIEISSLTLDDLVSLVGNVRNIVVVEECVSGGCLASKLALEVASSDFEGKIIPLNLGDAIVPHANIDELMEMYSLDAQGIAKKVCSAT